MKKLIQWLIAKLFLGRSEVRQLADLDGSRPDRDTGMRRDPSVYDKIQYEGARGPGCGKCNGRGWMIIFVNPTSVIEALERGEPPPPEGWPTIMHAGPCGECSMFKYAFLMPDDTLSFADTTLSVVELEEAGGIKVRGAKHKLEGMQ